MSEEQLNRYRTRLREAMEVIERLRGRLAADQASTEPLAIVGMACRFPGGSHGPEAFWRVLERGIDGVREIPAERWPAGTIPGERPEVRWAGLLDTVDGFDAEFFAISRREAERLDPQQRMLLELGWEALEDAGLVVDILAQAPVGVFVGLNSTDYQHRMIARGLADIDAYSATGTLLSTASGRISYSLGFTGPCVSIDTACSSSLVAMALAGQSLRARECEVALAGGVTLLLSPYMMAMAAGTQALAPDGRCKVLDARANGFVRGEGCGMVVLKRLSDAVRDGDLVRAVIPGWAVNQDGRSTGLTAPNVRSQADLLRTALARARVAPHEVGYVEMHGTGTPLGDPIETEALRTVLGGARADGSRCVLGAVKSNVGHLEAAAGVAGVIKTVLALEHESIPANLHFRRLNPRIALDGTPLVVAREPVPWPRTETRRVAGVSSFGISGTNVHVVLHDAERASVAPSATPRQAELLVLGAKTEVALAGQAARLGEWLASRPGEPPALADLGLSLATTRTPMEQRLAIVATTREELVAALALAARGELPARAARGRVSPTRGSLAFLFTGQGAQLPGMGRGLHAAWPAFREAFDACIARFDRELPRSLREVMWATPGSDAAALLDETAYTQPALFTLEHALAALWRAWGVVPDFVAGHSIGELTAACFAGVLSLDDAVRLVAARGRLMQALPAGGAMVSIEATEEVVAAALAGHGSTVSIASVNAETQVVIAGEAHAVASIRASFSARGMRTRALRVSHAFHSPLVEPMLAELRQVAQSMTFRPAELPLVSNVTGARAGSELATAEYWVRHARETVRFRDGVRALHDAGVRMFVEIGPGATLVGQVPACLPATTNGHAEAPTLVRSLRSERDEAAQVLAALGTVWTTGRAVGWSRVFPAEACRTRLPTYAWQHERYWLDALHEPRGASGEATGHPLLGTRLPSPDVEARFEVILGVESHPWLGDHRVAGAVVVPAAALAELVRAAVAAGHERAPRVSRLVLAAPLVLPEVGGHRVQVVVRTTGEPGEVAITVHGQGGSEPAGAAWVEHVTATAHRGAAVEAPGVVDVAALRARCDEPLEVEALRARFGRFGIAYGPAFRTLRSLWRGRGEALAEVGPVEGAAAFGLAPPLLDAAFQAMLAVLPASEGEGLRMPFEIGGLVVHRAGVDAAWAHVALVGEAADVTLLDAAGQVIATVEALRLQAADPTALRGRTALADACHRLAWRSVEAPPQAEPSRGGRRVLLWSEPGARALAERLGASVVTEPSSLAAALEGASDAEVVCVWSDGEDPAPAVARRVTLEGLEVVRALVDRGHAGRLYWVTLGSQAVVDGEAIALGTTALWGLGRTVMQEHPELRCTLVDVAPAEDVAPVLARELAAAGDEDQIAWRAGRRLVARLVRATPAPSRAVIEPQGTVLVTGGLGGLGREVARWLARRGVPHLLLVGRRGRATPGVSEAIAELEGLGARVTVAAVDVADRDALASVLRELPEAEPLRGVVHAAGVIDDGRLAAITPASVERVLGPKVSGAWNLHTLTTACDLGFFVCLSSLAGVLGAAGQGHYAAANRFLDGLAAHRRALGLPGQSLAFGAWAEAGMAATLDPILRDRLARRGMVMLDVAQGIALLDAAMQRPEAELGLGRFDLAAVGRSSDGARPLWRELVGRAGAGAPTPRPAGDEGWRARLAMLAAGRRLEEVRSAVQAEVSRVLSWSGTDAVPRDRPLRELGLDSLMAVELRNALGRRVGATLPATLAFDYPTVDAIAGFVLDALGVDPPAAPERAAAPAEAPRGADVPIAIIGMSCRLPGAVNDPESLWRLLDEGRDAITVVPRERWDADAIYDPDPEALGKSLTRHGGFVADIDRFDPGFFGISPREAVRMDPQQRLLLETAWEALEHAGIAPSRVMGSDAGVFVGLMYQEYGAMVDDPSELDGYVSTGGAASVASGRLSYVLGLRGPSMTVDTACSSSLVTVHLACEALRRGECSLALAGGAALMLTPTVFVEFSRLRGLASDGRCKSFAAAADGVGWSEGCGMIALKRLPDALRDGDPVLGVIRGSAVNQDGRSNGLTAPNGPSQQAVIERALAQAGVSAAELDYVECHGTGTALGDPIEAQALGAVMAKARRADRPLVIGSVKSNLGHTQAAAGVTGILKVLLSLAHERIPKSLHAHEPTPHVPWSDLPLALASEPVAWPRTHVPRRAGVSSFGVSGTNAHVVIEEAPPRAAPAGTPAPERPTLVVLSARDELALAQARERLARALEPHPEPSLEDVAASLALGRDALDERLALVVESRRELLAALRATGVSGGSRRGRVPPARPKLVFVFPGQGGQWLGMGRQLLAEEPVFAASIEACDRAIAAEVGWSVLAELAAPPERSRMDRIEVVQPVLFAMEVALAALWRAWGIEPDAVVGHSMGEVAAAHVAGALGLEDAVRVICRRSRLLQGKSGQGEMALVELSHDEAEAALVGLEAQLAVAASNGPRATVIAGDPAVLAEVLARLQAAGVFCRRIKVDVASHSPQVDSLREPLLDALHGLRPTALLLPMRSTVTATAIEGPELGADYWMHNLRRPVRFGEVVASLLDEGHGIFVEMSPHPVLTPSIEELRQGSATPGCAVGSQRRDRDERRGLLESLATLWVHGCAVAWERLVSERAQRVALPSYPWQRRRYWVERSRRRSEHGSAHPLLGAGLSMSTLAGVRVWESTLARDQPAWLEDHQVHDAVVMPGAGMVELALAAGAELLDGRALQLRELAFLEALVLDEPRRVQVVTEADGDGWRLQIASRAAEASSAPWTLHGRGRLDPAPAAGAGEGLLPLDLDRLQATLGAPLDAETVYTRLAARGLEYGPAFRGVVALWRGEEQALGRIERPASVDDARRCQLHPALLDACWQVMMGAFADDEVTWLPVEVSSLHLVRPPRGELWCHAQLHAPDPHDSRRRRADLRVTDATGHDVVRIAGLVVQPVASRREEDDWFIALDWEPTAIPTATASRPRGRVLVLGEGAGLGAHLCAALEDAGHAVIHATEPSATGAGRWPFDDREPAALRSLLGDAFGGQAPTAVVHLRSLGGAAVSRAPEVEPMLVRGCDSVLHTVQAITAMEHRDPPRLWVVTRGAQALEGQEQLAIEASPQLGLARVVAMEHPELRCARIDLDPAATLAEDVEALMAELGSDGAEDEVAWRARARRVARLVRRPPERRGTRPNAAWTPSPTGSYLVTGGLGGLGLQVADWLAERGAGRIVLMGRTGVTSEAQARAIAAIETRGVPVEVVQADVADRERVLEVVAAIAAAERPLAGVVHAAGLLDDGLIARQDRARLRRVMAPKILGALNLDEATRGLPLDLFVLYASSAGLFGAPGQGNYAAANTFLDALAHRRRAEGRVALSVDWGAFAEVGLAAIEGRGDRLGDRGLRSLRPHEGLAALGRLLDADTTQSAVVPIDVRQWVELFPAAAASPMLSRLSSATPTRGRGEAVALRARLATGGTEARRLVVLEFLRTEAARVLRLAIDDLDVETPLTALGMDSLMGLELRNVIERALGLRIPATLLWTFPTLAALAEHLLALLPDPAREPRAPAPTTAPASAPALDEDDLLALLDESLARATK